MFAHPGTSYLSRSDYEHLCAALLHTTLEILHEDVPPAVPCHCGRASCPGWTLPVRPFPGAVDALPDAAP